MNESSSRSSRNVSRAIARSRAVRAGVARRRRRVAALAACLGAVVGVPLAWSMAEPAGAVLEAAVNKAQDLADILSQRSPGTRTEGQLTKTKHARALSKVRTLLKVAGHPAPPNAPITPNTAALVDLLQPPIVPVEIASAQPPIAPPPTLGTILASMPGDPAFTPPGGGSAFTPPSDGGGPVSFPSSEPKESLPPTSAVPEPGTWAMMLMGFGLIAWRIRRQPPQKKLRRAAL